MVVEVEEEEDSRDFPISPPPSFTPFWAVMRRRTCLCNFMKRRRRKGAKGGFQLNFWGKKVFLLHSDKRFFLTAQCEFCASGL